jgi:uncharacterized protein (DUF2147 family)
MIRLLAIAAFLLASSAAQAQYQFEYGGRTIRIDPDRGTVSIPGVYDNTGRKSKRARTDQNSSRKQGPRDAKAEPQAPASQAPADAAPAPAAVQPAAPANTATTSPEPSAAPANTTPADVAALPPPPAAAPAPGYVSPVQQDAAPAPIPAPAPATAAVPPLAPNPQVAVQQQPTPAPAVRDPNSPLGIWLTEEKEGKVRIEPCGDNLCGYSVDAKSNLNGEQVLINMKPGKDLKWSGRILDPNTGSTYDSTIAMKGSNTLRVQGCAFGGMFCGGQTWTRVN